MAMLSFFCPTAEHVYTDLFTPSRKRTRTIKRDHHEPATKSLGDTSHHARHQYPPTLGGTQRPRRKDTRVQKRANAHSCAGVLIGTVDVVDCEQVYRHEDEDNRFARFAYVFADPRRLTRPREPETAAADLVSSIRT